MPCAHRRRGYGLLIIALLPYLGACASGGAVTSTRPLPDPPRASSLRDRRDVFQRAIVDTALSLKGIPYRNGGSNTAGFDCSGFTQYVFARHGVTLPREVRDQYGLGRKVKAGELSAGDLVFFRTVARGPSHVGIVTGPDHFVHAPSSRGVVRVEQLSTRYWSHRLVGIRRVTAER